MTLDRLITLIQERVTASGFHVASNTVDLENHSPSAPEQDNAISVHPDGEIRDTESRGINRDTLRVVFVTRMPANHRNQTNWEQELRVRTVIVGKYERSRVKFISSIRGYHPSNQGWYRAIQTFESIREV